METISSINKNALYNIAKNAFSIIFPLITVPYISRVLGAENTGKINFGGSIIGYFSLIASLGITTYAVRECAAVSNDRKRLSKISNQIFSINMISTCIAYISLFVTMFSVESLFPYRQLILIQSISIVLTTLGADWLNTAMGDFKYITIRTIWMQFISLLGMFIFVNEAEDYYVYAWISVLASGGANLLNIIYRKRYCKIAFTIHMDLKKHLPSIFLLFSMIVAQTIFVNTDTTILGLVKGDFEVGLYSISTKIYGIVNQMVASIAWVIMPQMSGLFASRNYREINNMLRYSLDFIVVLGIPVVIGLNVLAREIILILAGNEYVGAVISLRILTISLILSFAGGFIGNIILLPSKQEKIMLIGSIISACVNLILNLILIPKFGLNAAAATTAIANGVGFFIGIPFVGKEIKINGLVKIFRAPLLGGGALYILVQYIKSLALNLYITMFFSIVLGALIYFCVLVLLKDEFILNYMNQIKQKCMNKR